MLQRRRAFAEVVRNCRAAARARKIRQDEELKSILFQAGELFVMAHVRGDLCVDEEALSNVVGHLVTLVSLEKLKEFHLEKGRINPFTAKFYLGESVQHVVCTSVFENRKIETNNDELTGTIRFRPSTLRHRLPGVIIYSISRPK